ncbi:hypothetical protein BJ875DRAFT_451254 [Amylocarpus encephaloides]|uniref:PH domain-containing protein n=1 Tax=Amylocarpus encephaloides TaxID=45428 RepID=A0A9P7YQW5_9HELO|nr:hypothetical protein BJ875DRAFT_451254 [Amylocarpus encephaloides]
MSGGKMGTRNRVLSFMSSFSNRDSQSPTSAPSQRQDSFKPQASPVAAAGTNSYNMDGSSPQPRTTRERAASTSRPMSMVQTYQPPLMDVNQDTLPELQPIFTFLNSHANKLYQEGYFLKLDDQNTQGRANADRTWTECFAQLVGTVLSLWDAAELDTAGQDGEVLPKFINLTDASIKMIESLPTRSSEEAPLQNVLSISTAGRNRYLLHFNSHHSLVQWTAGIRLAMFEHATLQEAYTGALIAGKGKALNNINVIMDRAKSKHEDWARVRFGAGTPWRRCWCVISPPDEKEVQKLQKQVNKKKSAYDRSRVPVLKGDIKFYDTKKTKKMRPIATITDAYSAFSIYPQSKPLIDASTLIKLEGSITILSNPPSTTEGFVFVMPEVHPGVSGFEMMLRWLFPVYDTFGLYGRPSRLIADTQDPQSLMFAMPKHRRYGYMEILDVSGLIIEQGSTVWRESEWRRKMKELTKKRMTALESGSRTNSRYGSRRSARNSFGPSRSRIQFDDQASVKSWAPGPTTADSHNSLPRTDSTPASGPFIPPHITGATHHRSVSETQGLDLYQNQSPASAYDGHYEQGPTPPPHAMLPPPPQSSGLRYRSDLATPDRVSSEDERAARATPVHELQELQATTTPEPVARPPAFSHSPGALPISKPYHSPELRRANSRMSNATLSQLAGAGGVNAAIAMHGQQGEGQNDEEQGRQSVGQYGEDRSQRGVPSNARNPKEFPANQHGLNEGLVAPEKRRFSFETPSPSRPLDSTTRSGYTQPPFQSNSSPSQNQNFPDGAHPPLPPLHSPNRTYEPSNIPPASVTKESRSQSHNPQASLDSTASSKARNPSRLQTSSSIVRKPLPSRTSTLKTPVSEGPGTPSSTGSLVNHIIDQAAFDMIGLDNRKQTLPSEPQLHRQQSNESSYDDGASTASPDYASTSRSVDSKKSQKSVERPRAGVKKTVGNTVSNLSHFENVDSNRASIHIDFGPTINYAAENKPSRSPSPGPLQGYATDQSRYGGTTRGISPTMNNYPSNQSPRHQSPAGRPGSAGVTKRTSLTPENGHYRNSSAEIRTLAWQPGMAISGPQQAAPQSITAEQFVAQRAAAAIGNPKYAHQRQKSSNNFDRNTPTPPLAGNRSSDYLTQQVHSRNSSTDILARPNSRSANVNLGPAAGGDVGSKLSAREQEHIARLTGQPLISMAHNTNKRQSSGAGLVGAIEARESEKEQIRQGINSQAVQNAIALRQQQQMYEQQLAMQQQAQQQSQQQMQAGFRNSQYGMAQYQQPQYSPVQQHAPQQQYAMQGQSPGWGVSPAASVFAQGGGWAAPSPGYAQPPQGGRGSPTRQSPVPYAAQQQYFPPQQGGQGQGGGNPGGYHGSAY